MWRSNCDQLVDWAILICEIVQITRLNRHRTDNIAPHAVRDYVGLDGCRIVDVLESRDEFPNLSVDEMIVVIEAHHVRTDAAVAQERVVWVRRSDSLNESAIVINLAYEEPPLWVVHERREGRPVRRLAPEAVYQHHRRPQDKRACFEDVIRVVVRLYSHRDVSQNQIVIVWASRKIHRGTIDHECHRAI